MVGRFAVAAAFLGLSALAAAQDGPPPPRTDTVVLETATGPVTIEIARERAPVTAANFLPYVEDERLDGTKFLARCSSSRS